MWRYRRQPNKYPANKNGSALKLANLKVRSDNFYDEDGEAKTLADVIEGILQPLALRIVQRAGKVYVYDINGLYTKAAKKLIEWDGSSQTMGVDSVYNNAKITWSTYAQSGNLSPESCWPESIETPPNVAALNNVSGGSMNGAQYFSYHYENKDLVNGGTRRITVLLSGWQSRETTQSLQTLTYVSLGSYRSMTVQSARA